MPFSYSPGVPDWKPSDVEVVLHDNLGVPRGTLLNDYCDMNVHMSLMGVGSIRLEGDEKMFPRAFRGGSWSDSMSFWTLRLNGRDVDWGYFTNKRRIRTRGADVIQVDGETMTGVANRILHIPQNKEVEGYVGSLPTIAAAVAQNNADNSRVSDSRHPGYPFRTWVSNRNYSVYADEGYETATREYTLFYKTDSLLKTMQEIFAVEPNSWCFEWLLYNTPGNDEREIVCSIRKSLDRSQNISFSVEGGGLESWVQERKPPEYSAALGASQEDKEWIWVRDQGLLEDLRSWGIPAREKLVDGSTLDLPREGWSDSIRSELQADSLRQTNDMVVNTIGQKHFTLGRDYRLGDYIAVSHAGTLVRKGRMTSADISIQGGKLAMTNTITI